MSAITYIGLCKRFLEGCGRIEGEGVYILKDSENVLYSHRYTMEWIMWVVGGYVGADMAEMKMFQQVDQDVEGVTIKYVVSKYYKSFDCVCLSTTEKRLLPKLLHKLISSTHVMGIPHVVILRNAETLSRQTLTHIRALVLKYKCLCFFTTHINPSIILRVFESLATYIPIKVAGEKLVIPPSKCFQSMLAHKLSVREFVTKHIMSGDIPWRVLWTWVLAEGEKVRDKDNDMSVYMKILELAAMFDKKPKTQIVLETFTHSALKELAIT